MSEGFYNHKQKIQMCDICDEPTERCEDDELRIGNIVHCPSCFQRSKLIQGDCLEMMDYIYDETVDLILCDLPYGVTKNKWDSVIDLEKLWKHYERIIKPNGAILLFGQDKFSARLMLSNEKLHRYNLIWEKTTPTGHLNAKKCH